MMLRVCMNWWTKLAGVGRVDGHTGHAPAHLRPIWKRPVSVSVLSYEPSAMQPIVGEDMAIRRRQE